MQTSPAVPVDELRLEREWAGETLLVRAQRGRENADPPFALSWLAGLVLQERTALRDIGVASLALSCLTIFPPLLVMQVVDKVLTHNSYSTLALLAAILAIATAYEALLGYSRRLIVMVVGARLDAKLSLDVFSIACFGCRSTSSNAILPERPCTRSRRSPKCANS